MNRLKLWAYVVLAIAAGAVHLWSSSTEAIGQARAGADARVRSAAAAAEDAVRAAEQRAAAVALLAARDPGMGHALATAAEPVARARGKRALVPTPADEASRERDRLEAARAAAAAAAKQLGVDPSARLEVWLAGSADFAEEAKGAAPVMELLRGAAGGTLRTARLVQGGALWSVAAAPVEGGAAIAVGIPLDLAWARALAASTSADVTVEAPGVKPLSSVPAADAKRVADAGARSPRVIAPVGKLAKIRLALPFALPVAPPPVPLLFADAPAQLVLSTPVAGLKDAQVVVSTALAPALVPIARAQWLEVGGLAVLLVLGLLFGLLVRGEVPAQLPAELVSAADRIERGDLSARAPRLAGKLGTLAAALNRAAEAAEHAASPAPAPASPVLAGSPAEPFFAAVPEAAAPEPQAFELPPRPPAAPDPFAAEPFAAAPATAPAPIAAGATARFDAGLVGGAFEAAPVPAPAAPVPAPDPLAAELAAPTVIPAAAPDALLGAAARTAAPEPAAEDADEDHWRQVFDDFLRVRRECGEAAEGLTFERFRGKLEKNRGLLVQKYGCRTVRFQVYVKQGKAALKATPVR